MQPERIAGLRGGLFGVSLLAFVLMAEQGAIPVPASAAYWFAGGAIVGIIADTWRRGKL